MHLLAALLEDREGVVLPVLEARRAGAGTACRGSCGDWEAAEAVRRTTLRMSNAPTKVLDRASKEAENFKDDYVSTEHLAAGADRGKGDPTRDALAAMQRRTMRCCRRDFVRGNQRVTDQNPEAKFQALENIGKDPTDLARKGKHDPVIGRGRAAFAGGAGGVAADEEQSSADWRAWGGKTAIVEAGAAHHSRRRATVQALKDKARLCARPCQHDRRRHCVANSKTGRRRC